MYKKETFNLRNSLCTGGGPEALRALEAALRKLPWNINIAIVNIITVKNKMKKSLLWIEQQLEFNWSILIQMKPYLYVFKLQTD